MAESRGLVLGRTGISQDDFAGLLAEASVGAYAELAYMCILKAAAHPGDPGSDWHWMAAACWDEAVRRRCPGLYDRALRWASGDPSVMGP